jgi:hypothetical protein
MIGVLIQPLDLFGEIVSDTSLLSSIAIILGAIFVVFQLRDDRRLIEATVQQADSSQEQARLTNQQLKQNYELATIDLVTGIYDFANSLAVQGSWFTVLKTKATKPEEFDNMPEPTQLAYLQMASLFESIGLLVEKSYVKPEIIDDMFATEQAWNALKPFVLWMRNKYSSEDYYTFFEKLYKRLSGQLDTQET